MPRVRFEQLFSKSPNPYMLVDRELRFVAANDAYLKVTTSTLEQLLGRGLFDAFPNDENDPNNESAQQLRASLERTFATGEPDALALITYRVPTDTPEGVVLKERYWSATHTPVKNDDGVVEFVLQHTVDITELHNLRKRLPGTTPTSSDRVQADILRRAHNVHELNRGLDGERRRLLRLFDQAPGFVCVLRGPDHVFELANPAYLQLVGHRDVVGKSVRDALPEVASQGFIDLLNRVYQSGEPFVGRALKVQLQHAPGADAVERFLDFVYQPIVDDGGVSGIFVMGNDVTDQLQAHEVQARLIDEQHFLADLLPEQVWTADPSGELTSVNARVTDYFGVSAADVIGRGWLAVLHPDDVEQVVARWTHSLQSGEPYEVQFRLRRGADAHYRWHIGRALPLRNANGTIRKWYGTNTDIDDQKRREEERNSLIAALEESNRELDRFAYVTSHDLKTPLRGIASIAQWIEDDLGADLAPGTQKHLETLRGRVTRMEALINGILRYARSGKDSDKRETIDTHKLVRDVVDLLAPPPEATIVIDPNLPTLTTSPVPLQQVFMNLISNAVKHGGGADRAVRVEVGVRPGHGPDHAFYVFSVKDNGPGIDKRHHERVWALFQTLSGHDDGGTGIGLSVVKKLVSARRGRVWIDSAPGEGATFLFTWPKRDPKADAS